MTRIAKVGRMEELDGDGEKGEKHERKRRAMSRGERSLVVRLPNPVLWGT